MNSFWLHKHSNMLQYVSMCYLGVAGYISSVKGFKQRYACKWTLVRFTTVWNHKNYPENPKQGNKQEPLTCLKLPNVGLLKVCTRKIHWKVGSLDWNESFYFFRAPWTRDMKTHSWVFKRHFIVNEPSDFPAVSFLSHLLFFYSCIILFSMTRSYTPFFNWHD